MSFQIIHHYYILITVQQYIFRANYERFLPAMEEVLLLLAIDTDVSPSATLLYAVFISHTEHAPKASGSILRSVQRRSKTNNDALSEGGAGGGGVNRNSNIEATTTTVCCCRLSYVFLSKHKGKGKLSGGLEALSDAGNMGPFSTCCVQGSRKNTVLQSIFQFFSWTEQSPRVASTNTCEPFGASIYQACLFNS